MKDFLSSHRLKIIIALGIVLIGTILFVIVSRNIAAELPEATNPENENAPISYTGETATRAQWISMLSGAMEYSQFTELEAFFLDVPAGHADYDSIQLAAVYNLINTDSDQFNPEDKATRAFVAVTAAKAAGFFGEPVAAISDISDLPDVDSIRLAVDNEIFICPNGSFSPDGEVTVMECDAIIAKIKSLTAVTVDPNHNNTVTFNENLINLTDTAASISYHDSDAMYLVISGTDTKLLAEGTVYLLPSTDKYPYGVARKVKSITPVDGGYAVENEEPELDEVLLGIDIQGEFYPDYSTITWGEGVTGSVAQNDGITPISAISQELSIQPMAMFVIPKIEEKTNGEVEIEFEIKEGDEEIASGSLTIKDFKVTPNIIHETSYTEKSERGLDAFWKEDHWSLIAATTLKSSLQLTEVKREKEFTLCEFFVPLGVPGLSVKVAVTLDIYGEIKLSYTEEATVEFGSIVNDNTALLYHKITEHSRDIEAEGKAGMLVGIVPGLNAYGIAIVDIAVKSGAEAKAEHSFSSVCTDVNIYMPLSVGITLLPQSEKIPTYTKFIWDEYNSPYRKNCHFESGKLVGACTNPGAKEDGLTVLSGRTFTKNILGFDLKFPIEYQDKLVFAPNDEDPNIWLVLFVLENGVQHELTHLFIQPRDEFDKTASAFYYANVNSGLPPEQSSGRFVELPYTTGGDDGYSSIIASDSENVLWFGWDTGAYIIDGRTGESSEAIGLLQHLLDSWNNMHIENVPKIQPTFDLYLKSTWQHIPSGNFEESYIILTGTIQKESWYYEPGGTWWAPSDGSESGWRDSAILRLDVPIEQISALSLQGSVIFENVEEIDVTFNDAFTYFNHGENVVIICRPVASVSFAQRRPISATVAAISAGGGAKRLE